MSSRFDSDTGKAARLSTTDANGVKRDPRAALHKHTTAPPSDSSSQGSGPSERVTREVAVGSRRGGAERPKS